MVQTKISTTEKAIWYRLIEYSIGQPWTWTCLGIECFGYEKIDDNTSWKRTRTHEPLTVIKSDAIIRSMSPFPACIIIYLY